LDRWLEERSNAKTKPHHSLLSRFLQKPLFIIFPLVVVLAVVILIILARNLSPKNPVNFKILNSQLIILDENNKEIWRYDTDIANLVDEDTYRGRFQFQRKIEGKDHLPLLIIKDIDQDGKSEVLFSIQTQNEHGEGKLFCFDHKGKIRWTYNGGCELKFGDTVYSPDYRIMGLSIHDFDDDGKSEIIIISAHRHFYPTQLTLLSVEGEKIGEYWNSGRISDWEMVDLDADGNEEIVASGCNNEYGKACVIVFDPLRMEGCSPQGSEYRCQDLDRGSEKYYVLFPRTEIDLLESPVEAIMTLEKQHNERLTFRTTHSQVIFELDYQLGLRDIHFTHTFELKHRELLREGKITSVVDDEYRQRLAEGLLYYDGESWVAEPTMTSYWREIEKRLSLNR